MYPLPLLGQGMNEASGRAATRLVLYLGCEMSEHEDDTFRNDILKYDVDIPVREFFFTMDQIAYMLDLDEKLLREQYVQYPGREWGKGAGGRMRATNIAPPDVEPNWRVSQTDFIQWMRVKGIQFNEKSVTWRKPRQRNSSR